jgi:hypothetical protein
MRSHDRPATAAHSVNARLNYAVRRSEPLYSYFLVDPPEGIPASNQQDEPHEVVITSMRTLQERPSLDVQGFELVPFITSVGDIYDAAERFSIFYPEVEAFVLAHTGASEVRIFFPFLRGEEAQRRTPGAITAPSASAHVDYTHETGPFWFDAILGAEAARFRGRRFAVINLWRPITGPLQDRPLTLCDAKTLSPGDLMSMHTFSRADKDGLPTPDGDVYETAIYALGYNPAHRWYYAPDMMPDEALLLKNYDSQLQGVARFTPHSAFDDPTMPPDALPRASCVVRCFAIC